MKRVYKYELETIDGQCIPMPAGARILTVAYQGRTLCIWALVDTDPSLPEIMRYFRILGTGHPYEDWSENHTFIGTAFVQSLVFHVFEMRDPA